MRNNKKIMNRRRIIMKKELYKSPELELVFVERDIITYSETEEWEGPIIQAGLKDDQK